MNINNGHFVISLDFEIHWGVFDHVDENSSYIENLRNTPEAVEKILDLFKKYEIAATWATVGFLFAESKAELIGHNPDLKPSYRNKKLNPYDVVIGENEKDDPLHFGFSLIEKIKSTPFQEIGTHTYSHYYCAENGADLKSFESDVSSAVQIAKNKDVLIRSIVLPRNQLNSVFLETLSQFGIKYYRGNSKSWMYPSDNLNDQTKKNGLGLLLARLVRITDSYVNLSGYQTFDGSYIKESSQFNLVNVPASAFLRPYNNKLAFLETLKILRIKNQITNAAKNGELYHLWWHPHNFGINLYKNLRNLEEILKHVNYCRDKYSLKSVNIETFGKEVT